MSLFSGLFSISGSGQASLFNPDSKFRATATNPQPAGNELEPVGVAAVQQDPAVNGTLKAKKAASRKKSAGVDPDGGQQPHLADKRAKKDGTSQDSFKHHPRTNDEHARITSKRHAPDSKQQAKKKKAILGVDNVKHTAAANADPDALLPARKKAKVSEAALDVDGGSNETPVAATTTETKKQLTPEEEAEKLTRTIFVGNLPKDITRKQLKKLGAKYGPVESVRLRSLSLNPDSKLPRKAAIIKGQISKEKASPHAYVVFQTVEAAQAALKANMTVVGDKHIRVDRASQPTRKDGATKSPLYDPPRSVFVGNLHFATEDEELIQFFSNEEAIGTASELRDAVEAVRIVRDPNTHMGKGIAYVLFKTKAAAKAALQLNGHLLRKRPLRVSRAKAMAQTARSAPKVGAQQSLNRTVPRKPGGPPGVKAFSGPPGAKRAIWQGVRVKPGSDKLGTKTRRAAVGAAPGGKPSQARPKASHGAKSRTGKQTKGKRPAVIARKEKAKKAKLSAS